MKLHIPQPCHEDWNQMLQEEQGRHCLVCSKTVLDFTNWEPEAIRDYLIQRSGEKVCGRFTVNQLDAPVEREELNWPALIGVSGLSFFKKVAAVIVVVFGLTATSCENKQHVLGKSRLLPDTVIEKIVDGVDTVVSGKKDSSSGITDTIAPKCKKLRKSQIEHPASKTVSVVQGELEGVIIGDIIPSDTVFFNEK